LFLGPFCKELQENEIMQIKKRIANKVIIDLRFAFLGRDL
jgi:hypothetical protein